MNVERFNNFIFVLTDARQPCQPQLASDHTKQLIKARDINIRVVITRFRKPREKHDYQAFCSLLMTRIIIKSS